MNHSYIHFQSTALPLIALIMLESHLSVDSVQRQVAVMYRELHPVPSAQHPSCRSVALMFFRHQVEGLGKIWTVYRDSLLSILHNYYQMDTFEPGSIAYHTFQQLIQETSSRAQQAHQVVRWLVSLRDKLASQTLDDW